MDYPIAEIDEHELRSVWENEESERVRKRIEEHPEWADNTIDEPPDYLPDDLKE